MRPSLFAATLFLSTISQVAVGASPPKLDHRFDELTETRLHQAASLLTAQVQPPFRIQVFRMDHPYVHRFVRGKILNSPPGAVDHALSSALVEMKVGGKLQPVCIVLWMPGNAWFARRFQENWAQEGVDEYGWLWSMNHELGHCKDNWERRQASAALPPKDRFASEAIADAWSALWVAAQWPDKKDTWWPLLHSWRQQGPGRPHHTVRLLEAIKANPAWGQSASNEDIWRQARTLAHDPANAVLPVPGVPVEPGATTTAAAAPTR